MNQLIEYMKLHLISLEQDRLKFQSDYIDNENDYALDDVVYISGKISATKHLMSVANDIIQSTGKELI